MNYVFITYYYDRFDLNKKNELNEWTENKPKKNNWKFIKCFGSNLMFVHL